MPGFVWWWEHFMASASLHALHASASLHAQLTVTDFHSASWDVVRVDAKSISGKIQVAVIKFLERYK